MTLSHILSAVLVTLFLANMADGQDQLDMARIIGGYTTNIRYLKYLVQVSTKDEICGGSLVAPRWVITAAHCVINAQSSDVRVIGGTSVQGDLNGISRTVDLIVIPTDFSMKTMNMDVAALRLTQDLTGSNVETIKLASLTAPVGKLVLVSGWGVVTTKSPQTARQVHSVLVPMWSMSACRSSYRGKYHITRSMVCAGKQYKRDSCNGDSGGPMVYNNELVGIVSFGFECASQLPGVYTSVPSIRRWFLETIAEYS